MAWCALNTQTNVVYVFFPQCHHLYIPHESPFRNEAFYCLSEIHNMSKICLFLLINTVIWENFADRVEKNHI